MAKSRDTVSAPPAPTPPPSNDVLPVETGEGIPEPTPAPDENKVAEDGTLPEGQGAGNLIPPVPEAAIEPAPEGEEVQPEIGGEPITDADAHDGYGLSAEQVATLEAGEEKRKASAAIADFHSEEAYEQASMAEEAFQSLVDEPFDPSTNLGDWDNDGKAGGAVPAPKEDSEKTNAELGEEVGIAHAQFVADGQEKPKRDDIKNVLNAKGEGKLPNGNTPDDEFWTSYDQALDREVAQLAADVLDDDERLRRVEKTLGLLSPRQ